MRRISATAALLAWLATGAAAANAQEVYGPVAPAGVGDASAQVPPGIPPRLGDAAERALSTYPSLSAARSRIRAAESETEAAKWLRFPSVSVAAVTREDRITPELEVLQPLWTAGRIKAGIERANALRDVADATLSETALDIMLRLSGAYFDIARTARLRSIYEDSLTEHRRLVQSMERRVAQEVSPRTDLELARARAAQVEQQLGLVIAQNEVAVERLLQLVGEPAFDVGPPPEYSPTLHHPSSEGAVSQAVRCDPTITRLAAEVRVAEAERKASNAAIYPQVGVQYTYDRFAGSGLGLAVRAQSSGGLSPLALAEAAAARAQQAEFLVTVAERQVSEQVSLDLVENRSAGTRMESTATAARATLEVTDSFLRQFVAGRRTWLDVMNAVREAVEARAALVEVQNSAMASAARLRLRTCDWQPAGRSEETP
jgi:adhesin transport system outer membrane protein